MHQMICPNLEGLHREDFDASDRTSTGTEIDVFEENYERTTTRQLSQYEAASILGVSERTFRRCCDCYEAEGAEGLYDGRLSRPSGRRVPVDRDGSFAPGPIHFTPRGDATIRENLYQLFSIVLRGHHH